jgi:hypothetical protein
MNKLFHEVNTWFKTNLLTLNLKKTHHLQFSTMNCDELDMHINVSHKQLVNSNCTKFLGLNIDNKLSWKNHIDYLVTKLSSSCFIMRTVKPIMSQRSLRIYFAYIHSIMTYAIIFLGNSLYSIKLFRIQKKVVRIMMGLKKRDSCRDSFKEMKILSLFLIHIFPDAICCK